MSNQPIKTNAPIFWAYGDADYQQAKQIAEEKEGVHVIRLTSVDVPSSHK
jgi:hypothetical protein